MNDLIIFILEVLAAISFWLLIIGANLFFIIGKEPIQDISNWYKTRLTLLGKITMGMPILVLTIGSWAAWLIGTIFKFLFLRDRDY